MLQKLKILLIVPALAIVPLLAVVPHAKACTADEIHRKTGCITAADCASGQTTTQKLKDENFTQTVCVPLGNDKTNPIWKDLQNIVNALAAGVGVVVIGSIIVGGIQYTMAGDQAGKVEEAKKRIANAVFALVAFFLSWAFLQWLIPGGVFG